MWTPLILAAGKGTRMHTKEPKALIQVTGRPCIDYLLETIQKATKEKPVVVVGYKREALHRHLGQRSTYCTQIEQKGTGHAVLQTEQAITKRDEQGTLMILYADVPFIQSETLNALYHTHCTERADITILTAEVTNPHGLGRIVHNAQGTIERIVEERETDKTTQRITTINTGIYCVEQRVLYSLLHQVTPSPQTGELYLTDIVHIAQREGKRIAEHNIGKSLEIKGLNTPEDLVQAEHYLQERNTRVPIS